MTEKYFNLGSYRRDISTNSEAARCWFNRGLNWCYGFNQEEAIRCFKLAIDQDPQCAIAYWGVAYAAGPFYNKPWEWYGDRERIEAAKLCFEYAQKAEELKDKATALEQKLIEAICEKHPANHGDLENDMPQWSQRYATAMRETYQDFPDDLDVICLTAEALMNLTPWKLWDLQAGVPASDAHTEESIEILQRGIDLCEQQNIKGHPGLIHFYIHVYEMSPTPECALAKADILRDLCPDVGHLLHMASHVDALCGQWREAVAANTRAIKADLDYFELRGTGEFYMISALHNYHFKMYAAMFLGQYQPALSAANGLCNLITDDMLRIDERYLASTLEGYYSSRVHVFIRFGLWQEITELPMPEDEDLYPITTIMLTYAKAISFAALGNIDIARTLQQQFQTLYAGIPDWHIMANNPTRNILAVAAAFMNGEVEYHAGNHETGFHYLREAAKLSDELQYSEPWPWMHPPRHALGALLVEQGQVEEALQHYEDDLGISSTLPRCHQHRDNIWSLHGYHECLLRLHRSDEATGIKPKLEAALANADTAITSSCCCRKT